MDGLVFAHDYNSELGLVLLNFHIMINGAVNFKEEYKPRKMPTQRLIV